MKTVTLLANPRASGFTGGLHRDVVAVLRQSFEVDAYWPTSGADAVAYARQATENGTDIVVPMGGDGIVHHIGNVVAETDSALGIIPAGTTNVIADILHIPTKPIDAAQYLALGEPARPLATLRLSMDNEQHHVFFATGMGLDAEIVEQAEQHPARKVHFGWAHYSTTAFSVLWRQYRRRHPTLRVASATEATDAVAVLVQVHWPYTYAGKIPISLAGHAPDGMHVAAFERLATRQISSVGTRALSGVRLDNASGTHVFEDVHRITIEADPPVLCQADGELLGRASSIVVEHAADSVLVHAPAGDAAPQPVRKRRTLRSALRR